MIVKLTKAVKKEDTDDYAYVCDPNVQYFVYAVLTHEDGADPSYMINVYGNEKSIYDISAKYFTILDHSIPSEWEKDSYDAYGVEVHIVAFLEMAHDKYFYEKLMNEDAKTIAIFSKYAKQYEKLAKDFAANKAA